MSCSHSSSHLKINRAWPIRHRFLTACAAASNNKYTHLPEPSLLTKYSKVLRHNHGTTDQSGKLKTSKPGQVLSAGGEIQAIHARFPPTSRWSLLVKTSFAVLLQNYQPEKVWIILFPASIWTDSEWKNYSQRLRKQLVQSRCKNDLSSNSE